MANVRTDPCERMDWRPNEAVRKTMGRDVDLTRTAPVRGVVESVVTVV
eukprot:CAMPEP_0119383374 /NCGR_PEP_ID=MMETSP1334-20130426/79081_1 /TAXON_ID=127549 /ORGANISM="Calcidiscus leptoporus, Strain RCC1130" /LENGTH=47 /DNA_ID= /DNA_START= /DNA_END= /DNA_ORIENTATION=